jgi:hypothetical protein
VKKNGPNSPDFQKQIAMFLQQVPVGSPNIKGIFFGKKYDFFHNQIWLKIFVENHQIAYTTKL